MTEKLYTSGDYLAYNPSWHKQDSPWKASQIMRAVSDAGLDVRHVAEIGCGAGGILRQLACYWRDTTFVGFDISPQAVELAQSVPVERVQFRLADMLSTEPEPFDLVLCIDVFEHVEDYFGFLRALKGRGSYTLFHIPLNLSAWNVIRPKRIMAAREKLGHIQYFTKETALATLQETGYEVVRHFYTAGSIEKPNRRLRHNVMALPRRAFFPLVPDATVRVLGGYSLMVLTR